MIKKTTKNALYAQILMECDKLLTSFEKELKNGSDNDKEIIDPQYKMNISNFARIKNNAAMMLIRNDNIFYTKSLDWKNSKIIYLKINEIIYTLELQSIKTLFSNEYEKILNKNFSTEEKNNEIDLSEINKIDFDYYKKTLGHEKKRECIADKTKIAIIEPEINQLQTENINNQKPKVNKTDYDDLIKADPLIIKKTEPVTEKSKMFNMNNPNVIKQNKIDINIPIKNQETKEDIKSINDETIDFLKIMSPFVKKDTDFECIGISDLIMDIYTISFAEKDNPNEKKIMTLIVAPADQCQEKYSAFAPTFAFIKSGKSACACSSPNKLRSSYQIMFEDENFVIRGKWDLDGFTSLVYPLNTNNKMVTIQQKHIKPITGSTIGHNVLELDNNIKIHVLPLASTNLANGDVGILVCLEDAKEDKYISGYSNEKRSYVEITNNKITYKISAKWKDKELISTVQIIK